MKVLFTSLSHSTHYYPMVPLAWALRTAGHEVRIASHPDLTDIITKTGLTAIPIDYPGWSASDPAELALLERLHEEGAQHVQNFDFTGQDRTQWTWEGLLALHHIMVPALDAVMNNDQMVDQLVDVARTWGPDLVICETFTVAGAVAARVTGAAHARMVASPDAVLRARQAFLREAAAQPPEHREDPTAEWIEWTLDRLGHRGPFTEDLVTGQWTIDSAPASTRLDLGLRTVPMRFVPYNGPSVVPDWLRRVADRPRVCLTLGVSHSDIGLTMPDILAALADLDAEIVATIDGDAPARLPDNVRLVDFVPMNDLLPTCAAVVHHGGIGTTATAELHGVPQIVLSFGWDTQVIADRLAEAGAGMSAPVAEVTAEGLREKVAEVLAGPTFAEGALRLRQEMLAAPSPNEIVPVLEQLTADHR